MDLVINADLLIEASGEYNGTYKSNLAYNNPTGFEIPGVVLVGVVATLLAAGDLYLIGDIAVGIGMDFTWKDVSVDVHLNGIGNAAANIPKPIVNFHEITPQINELEMKAAFYIDPQITFDVSLPLADEQISAGLGGKAGVLAMFGTETRECPLGIQFNLDFSMALQSVYTLGSKDNTVETTLWDAPIIPVLNKCLALTNLICPSTKLYLGKKFGCVLITDIILLQKEALRVKVAAAAALRNKQAAAAGK